MTKQKIVKRKRKGKIKIEIGDKFGRLEIIENLGTTNKNTRFRCRCECGNITSVCRCGLRSGRTKSCGCFLIETRTTHGMSRTPTYNAWVSMIQRCTNHNNISHKNYGERGITVCKKWQSSFEAFFKDMGKKPKGLTLERINNNLGYSKDNCKWATRVEQNRNQRLYKTNKTGVNGVHWDNYHQKYGVEIRANRKYFIGYFKNLEDAKAARIAAEKKYWGKGV